MPWTARDLVRVIEAKGGRFLRPGRRHDVYVVPGRNRPIEIPRHRGDLPTGTAHAILRQIGISDEEARKLT